MSKLNVIYVGGWGFLPQNLSWFNVKESNTTYLSYKVLYDYGSELEVEDINSKIGELGRKWISSFCNEESPKIFVGWSLGSQVLLDMFTEAIPNTVGVLLLSPTPKFLSGKGWSYGASPQELRAIRSKLKSSSWKAIKDFQYSVNSNLGKELTNICIDYWCEKSLLEALSYLESCDLRNSDFSIPNSCIVAGVEDIIVPAQASQETARMVHCKNYIEVPCMGHDVGLFTPLDLQERIQESLFNENYAYSRV